VVPPDAMAEAADMDMDDMSEATEEAMMGDEMAEATEEPMDEDMGDEELSTITEIVVAAATAEEDAEFTTLLAAVEASGTVADLLNEDGPFTVFAPTDAAFEATLEQMGMSAEDLLASTISVQSTLSYHVLDGAFLAEDVIGLIEESEDGEVMVPTLLGAPLTISLDDDGNVIINGTTMVIDTDIMASNGVVHVIDMVLLPAQMPAGAPDAPDGDAEATEEAMGDDDMGDEMAEATEEPMDDMAEDDMMADEPMGMDMSGSITSVCLVTDQGGVDDGTFNQLAFEGMTRAAEDFGLTTEVLESETPSDFDPNIQTCLSSGADAIITVGFLLEEDTRSAAEANPDIFFIGVDQFFADHPDNLVGIQYREDQAGFLVGVMAARLTESGTIGGVYGVEIPPVVKFRNGYEQGARFASPDINVLGSYADSFTDPARGADIAQALIGDGADVVFGAGGQTGSGGIQFAAQESVFVIGVDQDEYFTTFGGGESPGAEFLITSATKAVDVGAYDMLDALTAGNVMWPGGGIYILQASNGGIGFAPSHDADVPQEIIDEVNGVFEMLAAGELETGVDPLTGEMLDTEE